MQFQNNAVSLIKIRTMIKAIINRSLTFGTLNGVIKPNSEIMSIVNKAIKNGTAKKLIDTEETLMYELKNK